MKKLGALSLVLLIAAAHLAADDGLAVSGDARTGLVFEKVTDTDPEVYLGGNEGIPGRVQINFAYTKGNFLIKWTSQFAGDDQLTDGTNRGKYTLNPADDLFSTAYGAASFLDGQFRLGIGKLGDAVWGNAGEIDTSLDSVHGARFELIPSLVPGLDLGFSLPASFGNNGDKLNPADFFAELVYGIKYAQDDLIDLRVAFKGDSEGDATYDSGWSYDDDGGKLIYGAGLSFLGALVPGFSVWFDGQVTGIKTNDRVADSKLGTLNWVEITYSPDPLSVWAKAGLETWADGGKVWQVNNITQYGGFAKSAFYAKAGASFAVSPWLKPAVNARLYFYTYSDNFKVGVEDPAALGEFWIEPYADFSVGNGLTVTPLLNIKVNPANSPDSGKDESKVTTLFKISLTYEF